MGKDAEELTPRARRRTLAIALMNCAYGQSERPARLTPATIREYKASPGEGTSRRGARSTLLAATVCTCQG